MPPSHLMALKNRKIGILEVKNRKKIGKHGSKIGH